MSLIIAQLPAGLRLTPADLTPSPSAATTVARRPICKRPQYRILVATRHVDFTEEERRERMASKVWGHFFRPRAGTLPVPQYELPPVAYHSEISQNIFNLFGQQGSDLIQTYFIQTDEICRVNGKDSEDARKMLLGLINRVRAFAIKMNIGIFINPTADDAREDWGCLNGDIPIIEISLSRENPICIQKGKVGNVFSIASPPVCLFHELSHAISELQALEKGQKIDRTWQTDDRDKRWGNKEEYAAIFVENVFRKECGLSARVFFASLPACVSNVLVYASEKERRRWYMGLSTEQRVLLLTEIMYCALVKYMPEIADYVSLAQLEDAHKGAQALFERDSPAYTFDREVTDAYEALRLFKRFNESI